jgi:hypothetical protein
MLLIIVGIFLVVILIKSLHLAIFALFHPHALGLFAFVAVLLLAFVGLFAVRSQRSAPFAVQAPPVPGVNSPNIVVATPNNVFMDNVHGQMMVANAPQAEERNAASTHQGKKTNEPLTDAGDRSSGMEPTSTDESDSAKNVPPKWTNKRSYKQEDSQLYVVHLSAEDTTSSGRDGLLDAQMLLAAQQYIDEKLYPGEEVSKIIHLDANYLHDNCVKHTFPSGDNMVIGKDYYAQLEFGKDFRAEVDRRYRQIVSWSHLQQLGNLSIAGLAILGGLYIYLRTTAAKLKANSELEVQPSKT